MIERPQQEIASATSEIDAAAHAGLVPQLGMMGRALLASPMRPRLLLLAVAVFLVIRGEELFCMPRTPYLPPGTLREALAYPSNVARFGAQRSCHPQAAPQCGGRASTARDGCSLTYA
jgi:hypothetical protein